MNSINFYVTTTINNVLKKQYAENIVHKKKFTPLVSIANSIEYFDIQMPNWDDQSNIIKNYAIWDLYRNSMEWLTYILDVGISEKDEMYINFCLEVINSWLLKFKSPGDYHSKLIWCDHAVSCRIIVFLYIYNSLKDTNYIKKIKFNLIDELVTHSEFLIKWVKKNEIRTHNHILIACISLVYYNLYLNINKNLTISL